MAKADKNLLEQAKKRWKSCDDFYKEPYAQGREDTRFALGEQWDEGIKAQREKEGRPCLTENRLLTFTRQVINDIRQSRPAISILPADDNADVETAKVLRGIIRNIEVQSGADNVYDTGAQNSVMAGQGWIRVNTKYADDESFDQEIELIRVPDFGSIMIDPNSKEMDGSDAEFGFVTVDMARDEFEAKYPDASPMAWQDEKEAGGWCTKDTIRVCEYFYKEYTTSTIYQLADGSIVNELPEGVEATSEREIRTAAIKWCKLSGVEILEKTDWMGKYIPLIPVYGEEVWLDGVRHSYSLIRQAKDPQRRYNYWLTASTEIIALQPKAPFIGVVGQFATHADRWSKANTSTYAYLEFDAVKLPDGQTYANAPQRQPAPQGSPAMFQEMMAASDGIKATIGIFNASLGNQGNETSGKAIMARQAEGDNATFHFVDNLQSSIRQAGRIMVDLISKIYTTERVLRIMGEDDTRMVAPINQAVVKDGKNGYKQAINQPKEFFFTIGDDMGKYDVVATVGASYATKRQETVAVLQSIIQALPESAAVVGDILVKNLDIPEAQLIVERMHKLNPALSDEQDPRTMQLQQAEQAIQGMQQQMQAMDQALQQKREKDQAEVASEVGKNEAAIAKTRADIEKTQAETIKIKAEIAAQMAQGAGITPEEVKVIVQTIAELQAQTNDTAEAVNLILSHEESKQATLPPEQMAMSNEETE